MKTQFVGLALLGLLLTGCWQKSLHPFYTANDLVAEPSLAGAWKEAGDSDQPDAKRMIWTFTRSSDTRFTLLMSSGDDRYHYDAHVFRLGDRKFLDTYSRNRHVGTVPAHHLFQIIALEPKLTVKALNPDWMARWLRKHPGSLAHIVVPDPEQPDNRDKDEFVITADTKALQNFIRDHLKDEDFFTGEVVFKREKDTDGASKKR